MVTATGGGGMYVENYSGVMTIDIDGDVIGDEQGILAKNMAATELSVTTAAGTTVSGETGIAASASGGALRIAVDGDVTGTTPSASLPPIPAARSKSPSGRRAV